jgi:hypothetical protein
MMAERASTLDSLRMVPTLYDKGTFASNGHASVTRASGLTAVL